MLDVSCSQRRERLPPADGAEVLHELTSAQYVRWRLAVSPESVDSLRLVGGLLLRREVSLARLA